MTFVDYMHRAARTAPEHLDSLDLLADAALGLCGEADEIRRAEPGASRDDELGDGWWYVAMAWHAMELEPDVVRADRAPSAPDDLFVAASRVAEHVKKVCYHHDSLDDHREAIVEGLRLYAAALSALTDREDRDIWSDNVAKLRERYPDGFEPDRA